MSLTRLQKFTVAAAMAATALSANLSPANDFSLASSAQAQAVAPAGLGCKAEAVVKERMKAEGQMRLIAGKATTDEWNENVFTSNENGTKGYNLEFDKGQICVVGEYRNIRVVDITNPNNTAAIPRWALLNYDRQTALTDCKKVGGSCLPHNDSLQTGFNNHQYLSFMAISQKRNSDGSFTDTGILTMTTNTDALKGSFVSFTGPGGASQPYMAMIDTTPTKLADLLSQRQQQNASNTSSPAVLAANLK